MQSQNSELAQPLYQECFAFALESVRGTFQSNFGPGVLPPEHSGGASRSLSSPHGDLIAQVDPLNDSA